MSVARHPQEVLDSHQVDSLEERLPQVLEEEEDQVYLHRLVVRRRALEDHRQDLVVRQAAFLLGSNHLLAFKVDLRGKEEDSHRQDSEVARCFQVLGRSFVVRETFLPVATKPSKQVQTSTGLEGCMPIADTERRMHSRARRGSFRVNGLLQKETCRVPPGQRYTPFDVFRPQGLLPYRGQHLLQQHRTGVVGILRLDVQDEKVECKGWSSFRTNLVSQVFTPDSPGGEWDAWTMMSGISEEHKLQCVKGAAGGLQSWIVVE